MRVGRSWSYFNNLLAPIWSRSWSRFRHRISSLLVISVHFIPIFVYNVWIFFYDLLNDPGCHFTVEYLSCLRPLSLDSQVSISNSFHISSQSPIIFPILLLLKHFLLKWMRIWVMIFWILPLLICHSVLIMMINHFK